MRISVEAWSPDYGSEIDIGPLKDSSEDRIDFSVEDRAWDPVDPAGLNGFGTRPLAFVDGTRRIDARLFATPDGGSPVPGVAGSVGVGAVVCDPAPVEEGGRTQGGEARVTAMRIERFLAIGNGTGAELSAGPSLSYRSLPVPGYSTDGLVYAIHDQMRAREAALAQELAGEHLVFLDGPLAVMRPGPRTIVGYIKSHQKRYLTPELEPVLGRLACGQRTPLFAFGEPRPRYSWYVRLCDLADEDHGWHGLIRCEAPAELPRDTAVALADASAAILPSFASQPYWDARAPQNLVPVAGLERRLRHLLGERDLVYRMIRSAAARAGAWGGEVA